MSIQIYVVMGTTGEYSDRTEWSVGAYQDRARADEHADLATTEAYKICKERPSRYSSPDPDRTNIYDRRMNMSYTGTDYYVIAVDLLDAIPGIDG